MSKNAASLKKKRITSERTVILLKLGSYLDIYATLCSIDLKCIAKLLSAEQQFCMKQAQCMFHIQTLQDHIFSKTRLTQQVA